jgi:hypothetical protein
MDAPELFTEFKVLLTQLDVDLRVEKGNFKGGICRVKNRRVCLLNGNTSLSARLKLLGEVLAEMDLSSLFVLPAVRDHIGPKIYTGCP